jgi:hypothetical protein
MLVVLGEEELGDPCNASLGADGCLFHCIKRESMQESNP